MKYRYRYVGDPHSYYDPKDGDALIPGQYISRDLYDMLPEAARMRHEVKPRQ